MRRRMKGEGVYRALYGRGSQPDRTAVHSKEDRTMVKKQELTKGEAIEGERFSFWSEDVHGFRFFGSIAGTYRDRNGRTRYKIKLQDGGDVIVIPDHYNLNQKLETIPVDDYGETFEFVYCGRTLANENGPVKDKSGKQMYEWLVGKVTSRK